MADATLEDRIHWKRRWAAAVFACHLLLQSRYESGRQLGVEYKGRKAAFVLGPDDLRDEPSPILWQRGKRAMKVESIFAVLGIAGATMAFTLGVLAPGRVGAVDEGDRIRPVIAQPKFTVEGCVFVVKTDQAAYQAGDAPTLRVEATNSSGQLVETRVWLSVLASTPPNPFARVMPKPTALWSGECAVSLQPGETKTVTLPTGAKLAAGQSVSILLSDKKLTVIADSFRVPDVASRMRVPVQAGSSAPPVPQQ